MSTEPTSTHESQPTTDAATTEIAARGGSDPWAAGDAESKPSASARAPRQFDPYSLARMRNLVDDENAYCR